MSDLEVLERYRAEMPHPAQEVVAEGRDRLDALIAESQGTGVQGSAVLPQPLVMPRRDGARRFALRLGAALLVVGLLVAGAVLVVDRAVDERLAAIPRVALDPGTLTRGAAVGKGPVTVLVVGTDKGVGDASGADVLGVHADTIALVRITTGSVHALWIPRDVAFTTEGTPAGEPLSRTYERGPSALVEAVSSGLGVDVNHYVSIDLAAFAAIIDAVGGADLLFASPVRDLSSGLDVPAGCAHLDGEQALALVRARSAEAFVDGAWQPVGERTPTLFRVANQQIFVRALGTQVHERLDDRPRRAVALFDRVAARLTVDDSFSREDLRALAGLLVGAGAGGTTATLPVVLATPSTFAVAPDVDVRAMLHGGAASTTAAPETGALASDGPIVAAC